MIYKSNKKIEIVERNTSFILGIAFNNEAYQNKVLQFKDNYLTPAAYIYQIKAQRRITQATCCEIST